MSAGVASRRPLSRRALLTVVWVGAFVILGLVGLRAHSAELSSVPVIAEASAITSATTPSAASTATLVEGGDQAGLVGTTGMSFGNHLHLVVRVEDEPVDPLPFIAANSK